jgi:formate dehydrogenase subunit gamma
MRTVWLAGLLTLLLAAITPALAQQDLPPPAPGEQPQGVQELGRSRAPSDIWRDIKRGEEGFNTLPKPMAGTLIQSGGESWRLVRNGPYPRYSAYAILGILALLALFFALRGRIRIEEGRAGVRIRRFNELERFTHWMTAVCFIVLALTGLNLMFGRQLLLPLIGKDLYADITMTGKYLHNYLAFGFILGIVMMFVLWIRYNLPNRHDLTWIVKGGGFFGGGHPPASKFNFGQKIVFWAVVLLGLSLTLSGIELLFPFRFELFSGTFGLLGGLGLPVPTELSPVAEMQLASLWHGAVGVVLTVVIIGHIYIGTLGMEGAFDAMGSGRVDLNWAREHHSIWAEEVEAKRAPAE